MQTELFYQVALSLVPLIGPVRTRSLAAHFGNASDIFKASRKTLSNIEGIGEIGARNIKDFNDFRRVEQELAFIEQHEVHTCFITEKQYPQRLLNCYDPPCLLYVKGNANLNHPRIIAVIGTRTHTAYGRYQTEKLVEELKPYNVLTISGLALGIDAIAHKTAVKQGMCTVGVMANGMDKIYPPVHTSLCHDMLAQGGALVTELTGGTMADKHFFPARNRIVAGMADAVVVMETGQKGGSIITAELGNSYHRDVFAFPGRVSDTKSEGCNYLLQHHKAQLVTSAADIIAFMRWDEQEKQAPKKQRELFIPLTDEEQKLLALIGSAKQMHIDEIYLKSGCSSSVVAGALLNLELNNLVQVLPGKMYECL